MSAKLTGAEAERLRRRFFLRVFGLGVTLIVVTWVAHRWERARVGRAALEHWKRATSELDAAGAAVLPQNFEPTQWRQWSALVSWVERLERELGEVCADPADHFDRIDRRASDLEREGHHSRAQAMRAEAARWLDQGKARAERLEELRDRTDPTDSSLSGSLRRDPALAALVRLEHKSGDVIDGVLADLARLDPGAGDSIDLSLESLTELDLSVVRRAAFWLRCEFALALIDDDTERAVRALDRTVDWVERIGHWPTLIGSTLHRLLAGSLMVELRPLDWTDFTSDQRLRAEDALGRLDLRSALQRAAVGERILFLERIQRDLVGEEDMATKYPDPPSGIEPERLNQIASFLEASLEAERALGEPGVEALKRLRAAVSAAPVGPSLRMIFLAPSHSGRRMAVPNRTLFSSLSGLLEDSLEDEVDLVLERVLLRASLVEFDQVLEFAGSLRDPFDGEPLRARIESDGKLLIWSVGKDGVDDGGLVDPGGADVGFRLGKAE